MSALVRHGAAGAYLIQLICVVEAAAYTQVSKPMQGSFVVEGVEMKRDVLNALAITLAFHILH